ncbi:MAG TPA: alpha-1,4-glucan--maltose-1-phosphate maltosyltransferase [Gaiellales bacterium]|nr:alpha-1,4-glucan--maltose-1-phosphate maltosyltransferase [Gaiellales bacterium]
MSPDKDGRRRVVIEGVTPQVDCGRFPVKRVVGDQVEVRADVFADGHEVVAAAIRFRHERDRRWREARMQPLGNDRFAGRFPVERLGCYRFSVTGWIDRFAGWRDQLERRVTAGQDVRGELEEGARLVDAAASSASEPAAAELAGWSALLRGAEQGPAAAAALADELAELMCEHDPRPHAVGSPDSVTIRVDQPLARCGAWYELFPRSLGEDGRHGTLRDVEAALPRVADMGFDVLYLPPIHPIGAGQRKGPNNTAGSGPADPGSPWAIGSAEGGHTAVHPELGSVADVRRLAEACAEQGIALALDIAFQCSPDHPWVSEHPEWFRHRPDGSIRYAENPPKRYEDIYPLDFECEAWEALWQALLDVVRFWIEQGVVVFRVDNPHTKPFGFWEWLIAEVKRDRPEVIFLAEAFTRPRVMERLAKVGFSQSYTYFAWRHTKHELEEYVRELTETDVAEYFRPNFWPNTPDILTEAMQSGGRPTFAARLVLAATLSASYGVYGPAFELVEQRGLRPGSEEYLDSEKYQLRNWDLDDPRSLAPLVRAVNAARRSHPALQSNERVRFHQIPNDALVAYSKHTADMADLILAVVSLDPHYVQSGWIDLPLADLGIDPEHPFQMHDLLDGETYVWQGPRNYVELDPNRSPAHLFHIRRRLRSEQDFEYFA